MDLKEAQSIVKNYLKKVPQKGLRESFIFGSFAKQKNHKNSDIDLALFYDNIDDVIDLQIKLMNLRDDKELDIEPHPFLIDDFNKDHNFSNEILKTGIKVI